MHSRQKLVCVVIKYIGKKTHDMLWSVIDRNNGKLFIIDF